MTFDIFNKIIIIIVIERHSKTKLFYPDSCIYYRTTETHLKPKKTDRYFVHLSIELNRVEWLASILGPESRG